MIKHLACAVALMVAPAHASQPIFKSMADCSGLFLVVSETVTTEDRYLKLMAAQQLWQDAAAREAGRDVGHLIEQAANRWRSRGGAFAFTEEFRDWGAYCRALSKDRDLGIYSGF